MVTAVNQSTLTTKAKGKLSHTNGQPQGIPPKKTREIVPCTQEKDGHFK